MATGLLKLLEKYPDVNTGNIKDFIAYINSNSMLVNYDFKDRLFIFRSVTRSTGEGTPDPECNGILIENTKNKENPWKIRAIRQNRIIYGKPESSEELKKYELIDGMVFTLYNFNNEWRMCSKTGININNKIWNKLSFAEILEDVFKKTGIQNDKFYKTLNKDKSYTFCMRHPEITPYKQDDIKLVFLESWNLKKIIPVSDCKEIGELKIKTKKEIDTDSTPEFGILYVGKYNYIQISGLFDKIRRNYYNVKIRGDKKDMSNNEAILYTQFSNDKIMIELFPQYEDFYKSLTKKTQKFIKEVLQKTTPEKSVKKVVTIGKDYLLKIGSGSGTDSSTKEEIEKKKIIAYLLNPENIKILKMINEQF